MYLVPHLNKSLLLISDTPFPLAFMDSANTLNFLLQKGLERGIIALDNDRKNITYTHRNKKYRFSDPEEQVRAETYCSLVLNYGYKPERIDFEVKVPHRTPNNLADIVATRSHGAPISKQNLESANRIAELVATRLLSVGDSADG